MRKFFYIVSVLTFVLVVNLIYSQSRSTIEFTSIHVGEIKSAGFSLDSSKPVHLNVVGAGLDEKPHRARNMMQDPQGMFVYAWIINAQTRELVWQMTVDNTRRQRRTRYNRYFKKDVKLLAGEYEIYFSAQDPHYIDFDDGFFSLGKLLDKLLRGGDWWEDNESEWRLLLQGVDDVSLGGDLHKFHKALKNQAVVSITDLKDYDFRQEGFTLTERGEFQIYAIGEAFRGEEYDYGWIVRASDSKKIWETEYENSEYAGGAVKNRMWKTTIELEPGDYWVYFVSDDSHSPERWNANPPYDPQFWGITITGVKGRFNPRSVKELIKSKVSPIVELIEIGDDALEEIGFEIEEEMKVRVYALGEGDEDEMYDYGWIVNTETGKTVWKMEYYMTRHGGGARKNRMVDEIITLAPGRYMVYYTTDGSHSYPHWNAAPPYQPTQWGITIYPADPKYSKKHIRKFTRIQHQENILAQIIKVRDDEHIRKNFHLAERTPIRIYAIGEGDWDEMYDYGWIEDEHSGDIVWEMTYDETRWAGGARKNRKVDRTILLPPGDYVVHFITDDSHSFNDWNAHPPDDPINYGITLFKLEK